MEDKSHEKNFYNEVFDWIIAVITAVLIVNLLCFIYKRPVGKLKRGYCATFEIRKPDSIYLSGSEGYGFYKVDKNGFLNDNLKLAEDYCIVLGSSHTQGIEVKKGKRYTDLLNKYFAKNSDEIIFYNMGMEIHDFLMIAQGITALTEEFSNPKAVIIEVFNTEYKPDLILQSLKQRHYNIKYTAQFMFKNLSPYKKTAVFLKEKFPVFCIINLNCFITPKRNKKQKNCLNINLADYEQNMAVLVKKIRDVYKGKLIIIYHPEISIEKNGGLKIKSRPADEIFENICRKNGIIFVNMKNEILKTYYDGHKLPYGFYNSAMGSGHFNETGHKITADILYEILKEDF